jgi:hypothetical protein
MKQTNKCYINMALQVAILLTAANTLGASTLIVGANDSQTDQDYQDLVLSITGAAIVSPTGAWQPMPTPSGSGTPYWNGTSTDCANGGIGFWITETGCFASGGQASAPGNIPGPSPDWPVANTQWYGNADGSAVGLIFSATSASVTVDAAYSLLSGSNVVGYDYLSDPTTLITLFTGSSVGDSATFTPTGVFELWLETPAIGNQLYNSGTSGVNAFAVFRDPALDRVAGAPEGSTWVMLLIGGALIMQKFGRRIHHRAL